MICLQTAEWTTNINVCVCFWSDGLGHSRDLKADTASGHIRNHSFVGNMIYDVFFCFKHDIFERQVIF